MPQLAALVPVSVSQPLPMLPSQLPNPALHAIAQLPPVHDGVPFAFEHALPHAPQFAVVVMSASHPFCGLLSQLPKPALQLPSWQVLFTQLAPAFGKLHWLPHTPQFAASALRSRSHPSLTFPLQLAKPMLHAIPHWPAAHDATPPCDEQTLPHTPQL